MRLLLSIRCFCFFAIFLTLPCWEGIAQDENKQSRRDRLMQRFDENKDGKLDEEERDNIRNFLSRSRNAEGVEATKRDDKIHIPKDYDPKKEYPFILTIHGYRGNGKGQLRFFPLKELAEKYDFIYCAPDGIDNSWNATDACCDWKGKVDDSKYLRSLILKAMKEYNIDKKRVFVTGLSNGGFMSYRLAHDHSDLITAIVPFAGVGFNQWPSNPKNPVSILHIHGTKDKTIKWEGGGIGKLKYPSAEDNFSKWKAFNGCKKKAKVEKANIDLDRKVSGSETEIVRFESNNGKVVMELWEVVKGGHVTPPRSAARERIIKWMLARTK